jgi:hypothetical protein
MKQRNILVASSTALAAVALVGTAAAEERLVIPVGDPSRPVTLEVALFSGDIRIAAYDGKDVVIVTDEPVRKLSAEDENPRPDGLRRIQSSSPGVTVEQGGNTVSLRMDFSRGDVDLEVSVPKQTSVHANLVNGGDVRIIGVTGEHELQNVNGDVIAEDIGGSAVINSTNGDVRATFASVDTNKAMSFTSFNGDVDVSLPAKLAADLVVSSQQGDVYTDFDVVAQENPTVVERDKDAGGRYRVRMQRQMRYAIGGGGPAIQFRTFNGDIMIRKR